MASCAATWIGSNVQFPERSLAMGPSLGPPPSPAPERRGPLGLQEAASLSEPRERTYLGYDPNQPDTRAPAPPPRHSPPAHILSPKRLQGRPGQWPAAAMGGWRRGTGTLILRQGQGPGTDTSQHFRTHSRSRQYFHPWRPQL